MSNAVFKRSCHLDLFEEWTDKSIIEMSKTSRDPVINQPVPSEKGRSTEQWDFSGLFRIGVGRID